MLALEGIKVIDFTTWVFASGCSAILGDWGADVIKIEDPNGGDPHRGLVSVLGLEVPKINFPWEVDNRNKRSVAIDLKTDKGKEIVYKLVEQGDVFVTNIRAGAIRRLGIDYATLSKINSGLIYAHGTGYGKQGPESTRAGYDYAAFWARAGIMNSIGEPDVPPPLALPGLGDSTSSIALAAGVVLALLVKEKTGIGQEVDVALMGTGMWCNSISVAAAQFIEENIPKRSRKEMPNPTFNSYECKDGKWIMLVCLESDRYWSDFCKVMGLGEMENDPRFVNLTNRAENCVELISILDRKFATWDRDDLGKLYDENGILWAPVQDLKEVVKDPQAIANRFVVEVDHPTHGPFMNVASPVQLSKTPASIRTTAPELGQHTEEVLLEMGYTWEDIAEFQEAGAIL